MKYIFFFCFVFIFYFGCSKVKDNINAPANISVHASDNYNHPEVKLTGNTKIIDCKSCHAADFSGGIANRSCNGTHCHGDANAYGLAKIHGFGVLANDINNNSSSKFHGKLVKAEGWKFEKCKTCHGNDLAGGVVNESCNKCHTSTDGPLACNTCHGSFANSQRIAPPRDLNGATEISSPGVGAHAKHLYDNSFARQVSCTQCHHFPTNYNDPLHIDATAKSEVLMDSLAKNKLSSSDPTPVPVYNFTDNKCSNVYCHGYFKNGNTTNVVSWTLGSDEAKCGRCHGSVGKPLPGGTHPNFPGAENCATCHIGLVRYQSGTYTILKKEKHINGVVDFN